MQSSYCPSPYRYTRRVTREVMVGNVGVGGSNPIRIQSMLTSDTRDTDACVKEALELAEAGCEIIRLTAQTKAYAANLENIARELRAAGCHVPLVADIHFKPDAAMEAAKWVEKIRINPGNFVDKKKFEVREYSDAEYREELDRLREEFTPLVLFCREHGRAMRIGSNHGSLSDRILNRFGDTPEGMVESAIEFAQIARDLDYHSLVFSMKASNVKVMVAAYRLLVERMNALGPDWNYPIHLGVTEAGGGEDGRIKSAVGIGALTVVGQCLGAGEKVQAKRYSRLLLLTAYAGDWVMNLSGLFFLNKLALSWFNLSPEAYGMALELMVWFNAVSLILWPSSFTLPNILRAAGDAAFTMTVSVISMWVFRVAFCYLMVLRFHCGLLFIWMGMFLDWAMRSLFFCVRFVRGRWMEQKVI